MGAFKTIIVGGGAGNRLRAGSGEQTPKQFLKLCGRPMFLYSLERFASCKDSNGVVLVVPEGMTGNTKLMIEEDDFFKANKHKLADVTVTVGGADRQQSVFKGLCEIGEGFSGTVLIHDAARPFVAYNKIESVVKAAKETGAALLCTEINDTLKKVQSEKRQYIACETPDRTQFFLAQTPQVFDFTIIYEAHKRALSDGFTGTDDCSLVQRLGIRPRIVEGDRTNIKITTKDDLLFAEFLLARGI